MKKILVVMWGLIISINLFAMPTSEVLSKIHKQNSIGQNDFMSVPKDSYAIAAGMKGILELGGDFRGFAPANLKSITASKDGDTIQVITGLSSGGGNFVGVYYTVSLDGGDTWNVPELISDSGTYLRNYSEITSASGECPYVAMSYCTNDYTGVWFTTDSLGPGGGGWNVPYLASDTFTFGAYLPSIAVNGTGDKTTILSYDLAGVFGSNYSTDYGSTWATYTSQTALNTDTVFSADASCVRWGEGNNVYGFFGMSFKGEMRNDVAGADAAFFNGYSYSTDGGANWLVSQKGLYNGNTVPNVPSLNGDTMIYYIDTLKGNGIANSFEVKAYLNETTGFWESSNGDISSLDEYGFGTWWYWWDAQYYSEPNPDKMFFVIPMASIFTDYFIEPGGDLHTFIWQGQSIVLGYKNYSDSFFSYTNIDIHDSVVIDSFGRTATWRGSPYSANLCYDRATEDLYIIYLDYPDTQSGVTSVEAIKLSGYPPIFNDSIITLIPNADAYVVETGKYVDDEGFIHIALVSGTQDSIYYKKINPNLAGIDILNNKKNAKQHAKNFIYVQNIISSEGIVSFELANDNAVEINLFDSSGRFVKTIADKFFKEGSHNLPFTADGLKQGIYFISLKINSDRITKKLIVMK